MRKRGERCRNYFEPARALFSFFLSCFLGSGSSAGGSLAGNDSMEASSTGSTGFGSAGREAGVFFLSGSGFGRELEPISFPSARGPPARLKLDYNSRRNFWTVLISIVVVRPHHVGFNAIRQPPMMRVDVHSAASLKRRCVLVSECRLRRQMGISAQSVSPEFQPARSRPPEPRPSSAHQKPPVGAELV